LGPTDLQRILKLPVPVIVELANDVMPVKKVLDFKIGDIIEFNKPFDAELNLVVADRRIGTGQAVKVGENFGLRVRQIQPISSTIQALGGG
ncbi:MAG: FliM/FliN family flagellar motor switch protein, partial [Phycisphaerae bacterium]